MYIEKLKLWEKKNEKRKYNTKFNCLKYELKLEEKKSYF